MKGHFLSVLKNATEGCITYYVGNNVDHVAHLVNCTLICNKDFEFDFLRDNCGVEFIQVDDPQLEFYRLSKDYDRDYLESGKMNFNEQFKSYIHSEANIGSNVKIGPGSVISKCTIEDNVSIHANVTLYAETIVKQNTVIESSSAIGVSGVMWVWDPDGGRAHLAQLGNVIIEENCFIGSNVSIVRGSTNESTIIHSDTCLAHGTKVGHGSEIGRFNHFANNVSIGGSVKTAEYCFFGSGTSISPACEINCEILLGAGGVIRGIIDRPGVYAGVPAVWKKDLDGKLSGVPKWNRN